MDPYGASSGDMKKLSIILLYIWVGVAYPKTAPFFPEVHQFIDTNTFNHNNSINYLFSNRSIESPNLANISLVHQDREWGYQWFIFATSVPTDIGIFSIGYSNYGSEDIPKTISSGGLFYSIDEYTSDTFSMVGASYQPWLTEVDFQVILSGKFRQLYNQRARSFALDFHMSSPYVFNRQVGIRTKNLISTPYQWGSNMNEHLPKFVGVYVIQPIGIFQVMAEHEIALNYSDMKVSMGHIAMNLDQAIVIFATIRKTFFAEFLSYGSSLKLTNIIYIDYIQQQEKQETRILDTHTMSIGVTL